MASDCSPANGISQGRPSPASAATPGEGSFNARAASATLSFSCALNGEGESGQIPQNQAPAGVRTPPPQRPFPFILPFPFLPESPDISSAPRSFPNSGVR